MYDILALISFLVIIFFVLGIAMTPNFISNSPLKSKRAKEMRDFALSLGLNYEAQENKTLKQKLFDYTRKTNIISGKYHGKDILIYDYKTVTNYNISFYGNDPINYTYVNGSYLKSNLFIENIRNIIDEASEQQEMFYKDEKWKLNLKMFVILIILIVSLSIIAFDALYEIINIFVLIPSLIFSFIILTYIAYIISKMAYARMPIR